MVMKAIVSENMKQNEAIKRAASSYVDDILVNECVLTADVVVEHLRQFGLECNPAQRMVEGGRVLGLRVGGIGVLHWRSDNGIKEALMTFNNKIHCSHGVDCSSPHHENNEYYC